MARYRASIETPWTPDEAFAYLSDFSTSAEWDPGVVEALRLADPLLALAFHRVGSRALAGLRGALRRPAPGAVDLAT